MDISSFHNTLPSAGMSEGAKKKLEQKTDYLNKEMDKTVSSGMGKDDFLKLLVTQLSHQDPLEPMKDKEFIAQMAQFSSLEQMTNLSTEFKTLSSNINKNNALSLLGKTVNITNASHSVQGKVEEVTQGANPQVKINGQYHDYLNVTKVL